MKRLHRGVRNCVVVVVSLVLAAPAAHAVAGEAATVEPIDCGLFEGDDRCESWVAVYDDDDLYDNSVMPGEEPGASDEVHRMAVSPAGEAVFTLGQSCLNSSQPRCRWSVVAHRADSSAEMWASRLELLPPGVMDLVDIAVSADGRRVYVSGKIGGKGDPRLFVDVVTIAFDATNGQVKWRKRFDASPFGHRQGEPQSLHSGDFGVALVASPVGDRIYVTGYTDDRDRFYDSLVIAYDGSSGSVAWQSLRDTSTANSPYTRDAALPRVAQVSPDGRTLYVGAVSQPRDGAARYEILAYQAHDSDQPSLDGTLRWGIFLSAEPQELQMTGDGSTLLVRDATNRMAAYAATTGETLWLSGEFNNGGGELRAMAVSPTGDRVYLTGWISGAGDADFGTIAYDAATGKQIWLRRYDGGAYFPATAFGRRSDDPRAVGVSPDGRRVYVTGSHPSTEGIDTVRGAQATVAYDSATGAELWVARYARPLDTEAAMNLVVGADGTVFTATNLAATSQSGLPTGNVSDWGVQAYQP